jgi:hypothetical protein
MTERLDENSEYPSELLLGQIDEIVENNPHVDAWLPNGMPMSFSIGLAAPLEAGKQPDEVLVASVRVDGQRLLTNVAVRNIDPQQSVEYDIAPAGAQIKPLLADRSVARMATFKELAELSGILESTDFDQPDACRAVGARLETPARYGLWHDAMVDTERFI